MSTNWDSPTEMLSRAQAARTQGDKEMAYQFYARASELSPQEVSAWQGRAETATSTDEALVSYAYASALDSKNQALARTLDAAVEQRIESANKGDIPLLVALGQELAEIGLEPRARALLKRALELDPASTDTLVWLAGVAPDEKSQFDYLSRALETNPQDPRARAGLFALKLPETRVPVTTNSEISSVPLDALIPRPAAGNQTTAVPTQPTPEESDAMERLRKLRAQVPNGPKSKTTRKKAVQPPADDMDLLRISAANNQPRLRNLLVLLLVAVVLLVILGIVLLQFQ